MVAPRGKRRSGMGWSRGPWGGWEAALPVQEGVSPSLGCPSDRVAAWTAGTGVAHRPRGWSPQAGRWKGAGRSSALFDGASCVDRGGLAGTPDPSLQITRRERCALRAVVPCRHVDVPLLCSGPCGPHHHRCPSRTGGAIRECKTQAYLHVQNADMHITDDENKCHDHYMTHDT